MEKFKLTSVIKKSETLLYLLLILLFPNTAPHLYSQAGSAKLSGIIRDSSDLLVPDAMITVEETSTLFSREIISNSSGLFTLPFLKPGVYQVSVKKEGFKKILETVTLQVNQALHLEFRLEPGSVGTSITVQDAPDLLQMDNMAIGGQLDTKNISDLPVRNVQSLVSLSPGVVNLSLPGYTDNGLTVLQPGRGALAQNLNIGGSRQTGNSYLLDGVTNTDGNINAFVMNPSVDSLQELRVQTSTTPGTFSSVFGGTVNLVTRAGTNQFHGELYDYLRNDSLNARPYNFNGDQGVLPKPPLKENQFGIALGGPLWLPFTDHGKRQSFFFIHYEGLETRSHEQGVATIPTAKSREGDLSDYGLAIFDPLTLQTGVRQPFSTNRIPLSRIDSVAAKLLTLTPLPTLPDQIMNNFITDRLLRNHNHQGNIRLDHQFSTRNTVYGVYHLSDEKFQEDSVFGPITGNTTRVRAQNLSLGYTHIFNPHFLGNYKFGYNRLRAVDGIYNEEKKNVVAALGITGINEDPSNWGFPAFRMDVLQVPEDDPTRPTNQRNNTWQWSGSMMLQRGRHTFDWGGEFQYFENNLRTSDSSRGLFRYSGAFTAGPDPLKPSDGTGLALADFLLGFPLQASRLVGTPQGYMRRDYLSFYADDTFRPRDRLSFTLGLRYEYFTPFREKRNNYYNLDFSHLPEPPVLVQLGNNSGPLPENGVRAHSLDFGPRFGIAYRALPKVIVRTAYGVYFSQEIAALYYNLVRNGVRTETNDSNVLIPQLTTQNAFNNAVMGFPSYNYIDPNSSTPYVQQWNLGLQWELPWQTALEAVYVGSKGTHLYRYRDWNNAFHVETGENLDPRPGPLQALRTFPTLGPILEMETSARSIYHALQLHLEKRFSHHFNITAAFTWGKSIDDADVPVKDFYQSPGAQDERKLYLERGLSSFDVRKRFTAATIIRLPFGKGERWGGNGRISSILGPWQVSSILTFQDGYPQDLRGFVTLSTIGGVMQRANVIPGQRLLLSAEDRKKILPTPAQPHPEFLIYNPAAVSQPGPYELGNAGRNILPTPGFANVDLNVFRIFSFGEKRELQIRADFLNAFNIVNLGIPIPNYEFVGFYGQLVTAGQMRSITFSLKFKF